MSNWWDELLERMFGSGGAMSMGIPYGAAQGASGYVQRELEREEQLAAGPQAKPTTSPRTASKPNPTVKPSATPTAGPAQPGLKRDEQVAQGIASILSSGLGTAGTNPLYGSLPPATVYLGRQSTADARKQGDNRPHDRTSSVQDVIADLNNWDLAKRKKFAADAVAAGYLTKPTVDYDKLEPILTAMSIRSAKLYERGVKVSPFSLLRRLASGQGEGPMGGPVTTTSTNTSVNISTAEEVNTLIDKVLADRFGRGATKEEKKDFLDELTSHQKKNPTVTKTTTTTKGAGTGVQSSDSSSTTSGGVDAGAFAAEWALSHNKDEAGSYQALASYMPIFYQALGAPV